MAGKSGGKSTNKRGLTGRSCRKYCKISTLLSLVFSLERGEGERKGEERGEEGEEIREGRGERGSDLHILISSHNRDSAVLGSFRLSHLLICFCFCLFPQ
jgi:hypothetical protein